MPSPKSIYLAGPITGLKYEDARYGWRGDFAKRMAEVAPHIECFSPMRAKEFLDGQQSLQCKGEDLERIGNALSRPLGILTRDANDVSNRDLVVANFLGAERVSIGTVWEIGFAAAQIPRKPLIVIMEAEGNCHDHVFVTHTAGYRVDNLEDAVLIAASILTPGI
jgi:nucleoside 2-deoxyribosyltransferase